MLRQAQQDLFDDAGAHPILEAAVGGLVRPISRRQILPWCTRAQNPKHAIEYFAPIAPRPSSAVVAYRIFREDGLNYFPLLIGDVHPTDIVLYR